MVEQNDARTAVYKKHYCHKPENKLRKCSKSRKFFEFYLFLFPTIFYKSVFCTQLRRLNGDFGS
jgi:hypothetical protein